jgi:hypothetical protein
MTTGKRDLKPAEIDVELTQFEKQLDALKVAYERYFMGLDRRPPETLRKTVVRLMRDLEHRTFIRNTAQKFRLRSLVQRWTTYKQYWDRVMRQIEEGTYKRDIMRAQRNQQRRSPEREEQQESFELDFDMDGIDLNSFQNELEQMDRSGQLNRQPQPAAQPAAAASPDADLAARRAAKLRELQRKLGLSDDQAPAPQPTPQPAPSYQPQPAASAPSPSADDARRAKLLEMKRRMAERSGGTVASGSEQAGVARSGGARTIQRSSRPAASAQRPAGGRTIERGGRPGGGAGGADDDVRRVYRNLVEAKRRCNEPTNNLTYESVARSMAQQRERMRQTRGSDDVDFKVVIKGGKTFLKPEPK